MTSIICCELSSRGGGIWGASVKLYQTKLETLNIVALRKIAKTLVFTSRFGHPHHNSPKTAKKQQILLFYPRHALVTIERFTFLTDPRIEVFTPRFVTIDTLAASEKKHKNTLKTTHRL
jgi:hypothetical protein